MDKLTISVISRACGIVPHTIRTWETRYNVFTPDRNSKGERIYSETDLLRAVLISKLINAGYKISNLARLDVDGLKSLTDQLKPTNNFENSHLSMAGNISIQKLFEHLGNYEIDKVNLEIEHLRLSVGSKSFIFNIVLPVMQKIGTFVAKGVYTVTQEHIVSTIVRTQLGQMNLPNFGGYKNRVVLATPDGNLHELSIIIADILCRSNRVSTYYLGASHPAECLAEAVNAFKSRVIIMGVVSSGKWNYEQSIIPYLTKIDKFLKHKVKIILGGAQKLDFPDFKFIEKIEIIADFESFNDQLENNII